MTEFSSSLSSLVFGRTRAGGSFLFQESLRSLVIKLFEPFAIQVHIHHGLASLRGLRMAAGTQRLGGPPQTLGHQGKGAAGDHRKTNQINNGQKVVHGILLFPSLV